MSVQLFQGDCLEIMQGIPDHSVDMVLCDLPYGNGTTSLEWDKCLPWDELWKEYRRIVKFNGAIVLFANEPFASQMRLSNPKQYKYDWIWKKSQGANPMTAKYQPMRNHENICVFGNAALKITECKEVENIRGYLEEQKKLANLGRKQFKEILGNQMASHYFTHGEQWAFIPERDYKKLQDGTEHFKKPYEELEAEWMEVKKTVNPNQAAVTYNPQMRKGKPFKSSVVRTPSCFGGKTYVKNENDGTRYPLSVIEFARDTGGYHPTQKPVALLEYLIKTYTNEGETVLDNTMGSGSTGVACRNTGRNFIGIELDPGYFEIAEKRINGEL